MSVKSKVTFKEFFMLSNDETPRIQLHGKRTNSRMLHWTINITIAIVLVIAATAAYNPVIELYQSLTDPSGTQVVKTKKNDIPLREGNGIEFAIITKINKSQKLIVVETKNDWTKVKIDENTSGWVESKWLK